MKSFAVVALGLLGAVSAQVSTIWWPVSTPSANLPWIIGQKNIVSWQTGGGTGIQVFDIQLHNSNRTIMNGFIPIALRVPMMTLPGSKNYGGEMEVDINANIPTGDGFRLVFMNTLHGQVFAQSDQFSILNAAPSNYTQPVYPTATVTATITTIPNPTQQWAVTMNGVDPDATATVVQQAGQAGSGQS